MEIVILIILVVFGILNIILFFKIWEMTNDAHRIGELMKSIADIEEYKYRKLLKNESNNKSDNVNIKKIDNDIELYSWIIEIKSRKEFQVMKILDENTFLCVNEKYQEGIKLKRFEIEKA